MKTHLSREEALKRFENGIKKSKTKEESRRFIDRAKFCMTLTNEDISNLQFKKIKVDLQNCA
jgi:hypothetical protein